jgi:putative addiction module component (TIGR02574 family)
MFAELVLLAAMGLPQSERAEVANTLYESIQGIATPEIEAAGRAELAERIRAIDAGEVRMLTEEEMNRRLREKYGPLFD